MKIKFVITTLLLLHTLIGASKAQEIKLNLSNEFIDNNLRDAAKQIKYLESQIKSTEIPTTYSNGQQVNWGTSWWCSGFYPGTVLYLYEATKDTSLLRIAEKKLKVLEKEKTNTETHDLGFMLYCSFGNALRLTGDSAAYKGVLTTGAESLASRFRARTGTIRSWDAGKNWDGQAWSYPVIIDNMMNLEFLMEASKMTGNPTYEQIAVAHANTTLKNHFRSDYSSYHVVDYNPDNGKIIAKKTAQGAFDESSWARGQAWALYGYTMMYRETKDDRYLVLAKHIAKFYLNHPNLPGDLIPYWDFDHDKLTPDSKYYAQRNLKDASTAAVVASALLELSTYVNSSERQRYLGKAEHMLRSLSKDPYKAKYKENGGFILEHSVGSIPHKTEVDVPLTYADYYYVEAFVRYNRLLKGEPVIKQ